MTDRLQAIKDRLAKALYKDANWSRYCDDEAELDIKWLIAEVERPRYDYDALEDHKDGLLDDIVRLTKERDAAVKMLKEYADCQQCKYLIDDVGRPCTYTGNCIVGESWEWRGVQEGNMERLTTKNVSGHWIVKTGISNYDAFDKLAAYEDTGLTPEEATDLARAKAEGRLVVLKGKPYPDCKNLCQRTVAYCQYCKRNAKDSDYYQPKEALEVQE